MYLPKISVITVTLNNLSGLKKTLKSVGEQNYSSIEYLIIDGCSIDGTVDFLNHDSSNVTYWQSEKDSGVYDAMNKGIKHAQGDYVLFLNAGDHFSNPNSLSSLVANSSGEDLIYGDLEVYESSKSYIKTYPSILNFRYFYFESLPHPACLISRKLFSKIGTYDCKLKIASDWKFFLIAVVKGKCSYKYVHKTISTFYLDGISSNPKNQQFLKRERTTTLKSHFFLYYWAYFFYLRLFRKYL